MKQVDVTGLKHVFVDKQEKWVKLQIHDLRGDITSGSIFLHPTVAKKIGTALINAATYGSTAILTRAKAREIKKLLKQGEDPQDIATKFGVERHRIYDISRGKTFKGA